MAAIGPEGRRERVLVSVELRFVTEEAVEPLADRIREAVTTIVGREALEEFRARTLPLHREPRPGRD